MTNQDWVDVGVFRLPMAAPDDVSGLQALLASGQVQAEAIVGIIAQTEGTGYARGYTSLCMQLLLADHLNITPEAVFKRIPMMMIGLCGGLMSPHYTVFTRQTVAPPSQAPAGKRLTVGIANTRMLEPEEYGTLTQVKLVAEAVSAAIADAGIAELEDVHCVEIKCPAMTPTRLEAAAHRGATVVSTNMGQASSMAKGACALGIALALGEVPEEKLTEGVVNRDRTLYTNRGSVSAGGEQSACRILVMGNSPRSLSPYRVGHGVMTDQLDTQGIYAALESAGLNPSHPLTAEQQQRIGQMFVNCGADAVTAVRGRRHTIHSDFLSGYAGIMAKAVANAVVAAVVGDPMILASAGNEHQGAAGSNLVAAIVTAE
ncbi:ring-opening amidohydrolase [Nodosilinea sp. LEGE 07088]|uniref:ring-opening amidohydrolase n=1 Tax=Nodosilinea sp. LEGE 07088 TaxID=2777968 RepID=UPI00188075A3|nr:ring-opening amidohydrolase [Nodosilinea sp. LEGE 07088]MBE9138873.1 ring-opening amidohydrolase [Nodosilinea sp. LEGE 07088]